MVPQAGIAAEPLIGLGAFLGVFVAVALWEALAPRRSAAFARRDRWPHNLGLLLLDEAMTVGVDAFRTRADLRLDRLLTQEGWVPFARGELRVYKAGALPRQLVAALPRATAAAA